MKKFTEEQIEMLGILPNNIAQSADFTPKAKLLLAELIFRNGMDKVADDGYFFVKNAELMEASGYSNRHVAVAINRFVNLGFISRKVGKYKGKASEYILNMEKIENYESTKGVVKGCTFDDTKGDLLKGDLLHIEDAKNDIMQLINELRSEIKELKGDLLELKGDILKGDIFKKVTTDTDTDSDTEKISMYRNHEAEVKDTLTEGEVTDKVESISVQVEEDTNADANTTSVRSQIDDNSVEVRKATANVKLSHDELAKRNDYISSVYRKVDERLNYIYSLKTYSLYVDVVDEIAKIISAAQEHRDWFTEPQWDKLTRYCERFVKLTEAKDNYFNGTMKRGADANTTSTDEDTSGVHFNDSSVDSTKNNPVPVPTDWAKVGKWVADSLEQFPTYEAWEKEFDRILNKKFGNGWENAEYQIMKQASAIYNRCTKTAIEYYTSIENAQKATPTPTEENETIEPAPWETVEETSEPAKFSESEVEEWKTTIKDEIRDGVYQWSLTLTKKPDNITDDDADKIVCDVLEKHPEWQEYKGLFKLNDFTKHTKYLMENRLTNKDIPAIVSQNQYQERHKKFLNELVN